MEWVTKMTVRRAACHADQFDVEVVARHRVERAEGFVHEQDFRLAEQRAADGSALAHPPGEFPGMAVREVAQAEAVKQRTGAIDMVAARTALEFGCYEDVIEDGPPVQQRIALEDHAECAGGAGDRGAMY